MQAIEQSQLDQVRAMCADDGWRRAVLAHCRGIDPQSALPAFNTSIHPRDQMLLHSLRHHGDAGAAFSQYFGIAVQQFASAEQILRLLYGEQASGLEVLDFACGYGRLLRFLTLALPPQQIWASELQADAVAFAADAFGVRAIASHEDPARFDPQRRFDFIWVASLFSHLPETLFHAWLRRLLALLTPRGTLCFSVRDVALLPPGQMPPPGGFLYAHASENAELATDIYGTTYADAAFVRDAVHAAVADRRAVHRLPKALAHEQDLYIVAADPQRDLSVLSEFRRGPWGWLDRARLSTDGRLHLQGWAASLDDGAVERVEIEIDGQRHTCMTGVARPDVSAAFADPRLATAGWEFTHALGSATAGARVTIGAHTRRNETALLYAGTIAVEAG